MHKYSSCSLHSNYLRNLKSTTTTYRVEIQIGVDLLVVGDKRLIIARFI